jgi:hypothetical protein
MVVEVMTPLLAALAYRKRGLSVIPVEERGKKPLVLWEPYQKEHATTQVIQGWYEQHPCANVGIVTGAISGIVVVDVDTEAARAALRDMIGANQLQGVPRVKTGRGWQLFFAHPTPHRSLNGQDTLVPGHVRSADSGDAGLRPAGETTLIGNKAGIIPNVDIRGDGGYVVAPPSLHQNGKVYIWHVPLTKELPPLPKKLLDLITNPPKPVTSTSLGFDTKSALEGVPEGQRDETIFKLASKLRGADVPIDTARTLVLEAASKCTPPYPEREAVAKVERAYSRYAPRDMAAPLPSVARQGSFWPELVSIESVISSPQGPGTDWLWTDTLPTGSASLLVAKPKVGKSNIAVNLALAVARGLPFLGRATQQGSVGYIFQDGGMDEIAEVFAKFGVRKDDAIALHSGSVPERATDWLLDMVGRGKFRLCVIDTIQRFFRFAKIENYSEVTNAMEPLLDGMQRLGCHVLFVHHAKKDSADALDSAVGSTALRGLCYTFNE